MWCVFPIQNRSPAATLGQGNRCTQDPSSIEVGESMRKELWPGATAGGREPAVSGQAGSGPALERSQSRSQPGSVEGGKEVPRRPVTGPYGEAGGELRAVAPGAGGPPGQPAGGPGRGEGGERDWRGVGLRQLTMGREESALGGTVRGEAGGAGRQRGRGAGVPPGKGSRARDPGTLAPGGALRVKVLPGGSRCGEAGTVT